MTGTPYTAQYNLNVQRQLTNGLIASVAYVGSLEGIFWLNRITILSLPQPTPMGGWTLALRAPYIGTRASALTVRGSTRIRASGR